MTTRGFAGRAGIVIETAPGHFVTVVMRAHTVSFERDADDDTRWHDTFRRFVPSNRIKIELEGHLIDQAETSADDAAWVTEAAPELPAATRELEE